MSLSRADLEAMDRDQLVETVLELDRRLEDLEKRLDAFSKWKDWADERHESHTDSLAAHDEAIAALRSRVGSKATDYHEMDREQRVHRVRVAVCKRAYNNAGAAALRYTDILALFDEKPSDGYAYKLMQHAADYDPETGESHKPGFDYNTHGTTTLTAESAAVNDPAVIHTVKNELGLEAHEL